MISINKSISVSFIFLFHFFLSIFFLSLFLSFFISFFLFLFSPSFSSVLSLLSLLLLFGRSHPERRPRHDRDSSANISSSHPRLRTAHLSQSNPASRNRANWTHRQRRTHAHTLTLTYDHPSCPHMLGVGNELVMNQWSRTDRNLNLCESQPKLLGYNDQLWLNRPRPPDTDTHYKRFCTCFGPPSRLFPVFVLFRNRRVTSVTEIDENVDLQKKMSRFTWDKTWSSNKMYPL